MAKGKSTRGKAKAEPKTARSGVRKSVEARQTAIPGAFPKPIPELEDAIVRTRNADVEFNEASKQRAAEHENLARQLRDHGKKQYRTSSGLLGVLNERSATTKVKQA